MYLGECAVGVFDEVGDEACIGGDVVGMERRDHMVEHQAIASLLALPQYGFKYVLMSKKFVSYSPCRTTTTRSYSDY
jgi:hypothetical protein